MLLYTLSVYSVCSSIPLLLLALSSQTAWAESIRGQVNVPATVTVSNRDNGYYKHIKTDKHGRFYFGQLPSSEGSYEVIFTQEGYQTTATTIQFADKPLGASVQVTLEKSTDKSGDSSSTSSIKVGSTNTSPVNVITQEDIQATPNYKNRLGPLLSRDPRIYQYPSANVTGPSIHGQNERFTSWQLNNNPINNLMGLSKHTLPGGNPTILTPDLYQAITIEYAPFSAKKGGYGSGTINILDKPASNKFHTLIYSSNHDDHEEGSLKDTPKTPFFYQDRAYGISGAFIPNSLFFNAAFRKQKTQYTAASSLDMNRLK